MKIGKKPLPEPPLPEDVIIQDFLKKNIQDDGFVSLLPIDKETAMKNPSSTMFREKTKAPYVDAYKILDKQIDDNIKDLTSPKGFFSKISFNHKKAAILKASDKLKRMIDKNAGKLPDEKALITHTVDILAHKTMFDFGGWSNQYKRHTGEKKNVFINMELRNGNNISFMVPLEQKHFVYMKGAYIIDDDFKYYNASIRLWCLDYHQDCCLPLKRRFALKDVMELIKTHEDVESEIIINPETLLIWMKSDIVQKVIRGAELEQIMGFIKILLICILVGVIGVLGFCIWIISILTKMGKAA